MGDAAAIPEPSEEGYSESPSHAWRRIEFHVATKQYNPFIDDGKDGFKLIHLTPDPDAPEPKETTMPNKPGKPDCLDNGHDPDLSFEISFRRIGAGLRNLGNTCFLNSVLQCLTYTEPLAAYLQSGKHQSSCRKAGFCALCAIQKHVSRALQATGRILEPKDLVVNLRSISRNFRNARQEDAHEYMVNLLESMHKCCLPSGVPSESPSAYEKSLVHRIFGGYLRSQVKCLQCSFSSNKFDPFLGLSLEIAKAESLRKALSHFTAKELLDGGARQYQCQQCKQKVKALKQLAVHKAPHVLIIHLKRFSEHDPSQKINKDVAFEPTLDLKPFVTDPQDGDLTYTLYGVIVHAGWSTRSGHYYCFIRTSSGMWYSLDDNQVFQVNEKRVLDQKAYILFYVRDRKNLNKKKSVETIKKENMAPRALGNAASLKSTFDLKGNFQNRSAAVKLDTVSPHLVSARSLVLSTALKTSEGNKESCATTKYAGLRQSDAAKDLKSSAGQNGPSFITGECNNFKSAHKEGHNDMTSMLDGEFNVLKQPTPKEGENGKHFVAGTHDVPEKSTHKDCEDDFHSVQSKNECSAYTVSQNRSSVTSKECHRPEAVVQMDGQHDDAHTVNSKLEFDAEAHGDHAKNDVTSGEGIIVEKAFLDEGVINAHSMQSSCIVTEPALDSQSKQPCSQLCKEMPFRERKRLRHSVKKTPLKYGVAAISPSSSIFFRMILGIRKKPCNSRNQFSLKCRKRVIKDEPSSSTPFKFSGSGKNIHSESGMDQNFKLKDEKSSLSAEPSNLKCRASCLDSSVHSVEKSSSPASRLASHMHDNEPQQKSRQAEVIGLLTRGLDTKVAKWEEAVASPAETEAPTTGPLQIGYVGDEWDEDYDKGKIKKVRNSRTFFGVANPFQETANRKHKRAKLQHMSRADNHPFRIQ